MDSLSLFNPSKWSLSKKISSIVLFVLSIPLASLGLLHEIEKTLVDGLKDNLALSTQLIASQLVNQPDWFEESLLPDSSQFVGKELYVFPIGLSFNLDGYFDDWQEHQFHRKKFGMNNSSFSVLLGSVNENLVLSLVCHDKKVVFPKLDGNSLSDRIEIEIREKKDSYQTLYLAPSGPGEFAVKTKKNGVLRHDWRYKAFWLNTPEGFNLELKFPSGIKPTEIRLVHKDIDSEDEKQFRNNIVSSSHDLNPIVWPSDKFMQYLENISLKPAQRIWLIDHHGRVLAQKGNLAINQLEFSRNFFLNWILANQSTIESDPRENHLHLDSEEIFRAMNGKSSTKLEYVKNSENAIAIAAYPIDISGSIKGVLLLEENVAKVQVLQKKALVKIFGTIIFVFVLVVWVIFWYVNRIVGRIKFLNNEIDRVVDDNGRISSPLKLDVGIGDEINDLYRAFSQMGDKLFEYNEYLEKLASRLSHELRTPIAIVRSSLDNLLLNCETEEDQELINRALEGNKRLGEIVIRMKQASGVKEAMQSAEKEEVNLVGFMEQMFRGYQLSFPAFIFQFKSRQSEVVLPISSDLFSELIDKLVANAMEFSSPAEPIVAEILLDKNSLALDISNSGPTIPKKNLKRIFHSLVSIRDKERATGTNLGLGLYVARLISDFHGFTVMAKNREDESGVVIRIYFD